MEIILKFINLRNSLWHMVERLLSKRPRNVGFELEITVLRQASKAEKSPPFLARRGNHVRPVRAVYASHSHQLAPSFCFILTSYRVLRV